MLKRNFLLLIIFFITYSVSNAQWTLCEGTAGDNIIKILKVNNTLFAGVHNSIFHGKILKSTNNGLNWDSVNTGLSFSGIFDGVSKGNTICFGTYESGLVWSTDAGNSWHINLINGVAFNGVFKVGVSGNNILTYHNTVFPGINTPFYYSSNNGVLWNPLFLGATEFIPEVFKDYDSLFIAGHRHGISVSTNNGLNWVLPLNNGLPTFPDGRKEIYSLFIANGNIYAGCISGFAFSTNMGNNWTATNMNFPNFCHFTDFVLNNGIVFGSVAYSLNSGNEGVYKSTNYGLNWIKYNSGLPASDLSVNSLLLSGGFLFAGSRSEGIYKIPLSIIMSSEEKNAVSVKEFKLSQNYPNPFNPATTIEFSIPKGGLVSLVLYDVSGKEVRKIINETSFNAGIHKIQLNGYGLTSGVYFYSQYFDGRLIDTKKLVVIK